MLFLTSDEKAHWARLGWASVKGSARPQDADAEVRSNLRPMFKYFVGALLAAHAQEDRAKGWFVAGAQEEGEGLYSNAFAVSFLERQHGRFVMPDLAFADPAPWLHFASTPAIKGSRENLVKFLVHSLPHFGHSVKIIDVGCGDGGLVVRLLERLRDAGKMKDVGEILLVDSSAAMCELAMRTVGAAFPPSTIKCINSRIQDAAARIDGMYDIVLCSLSYHHMPYENKRTHLVELAAHADHILVFELNANNDRPELYSPELAVSVYQSYGRLIDAIFAHDAPVGLANACVDRFLMTEAVSLLTQPRFVRSDYHMLRSEWHGLFQSVLGGDFVCSCDATAYSDEYLDLFTLHYGR